MTLESLPSHPLRPRHIWSLRGADGVADAFVRFEVSESVDDPDEIDQDAHVVQFVTVLESGTAVAAHFDPVARSWSRLDRVDVDPEDPEDVGAVIEQLDELLEAERDGDEAYGQLVVDELGIGQEAPHE